MALVPTPGEIQYMKEHIHESRTKAIIAANASCLCIATIAVCLRFISRNLIRAKIKADDWLIALAVFFCGFTIPYCVGTLYGIGRHAIVVTHPKALTEIFFVIETCYVCALAAIKLSILFLYHRIFPQIWFRNALILVGSIFVSWTIAAVFSTIFQCLPIKAQWDPTVPARCINFAAFNISLLIINIITDLVILAFPIRPVWQLQASAKKKWMLTLTFAIGCGACIVSIVRLVYVRALTISYDSSWNLSHSGEVATSEVTVGIVAACFPAYRPLYRYCSQKLQSRGVEDSQPSKIVSANAGTGKEQSQTVNFIDKSSIRQGDIWIPLEDDEERLVKTTKRDKMDGYGAR